MSLSLRKVQYSTLATFVAKWQILKCDKVSENCLERLYMLHLPVSVSLAFLWWENDMRQKKTTDNASHCTLYIVYSLCESTLRFTQALENTAKLIADEPLCIWMYQMERCHVKYVQSEPNSSLSWNINCMGFVVQIFASQKHHLFGMCLITTNMESFMRYKHGIMYQFILLFSQNPDSKR